jgi:hypothetical protein
VTTDNHKCLFAKFSLNHHLVYSHSQQAEQLGDTTETRCQQYRSLFATQLDGNAIHVIRNALEYSMPLGDGRFVSQIEAALGHKVGYAKRGRPRVKVEEAESSLWE